jgi:hypothetical protein
MTHGSKLRHAELETAIFHGLRSAPRKAGTVYLLGLSVSLKSNELLPHCRERINRICAADARKSL